MSQPNRNNITFDPIPVNETGGSEALTRTELTITRQTKAIAIDRRATIIQKESGLALREMSTRWGPRRNATPVLNIITS
jgi:hypothetical protein